MVPAGAHVRRDRQWDRAAPIAGVVAVGPPGGAWMALDPGRRRRPHLVNAPPLVVASSQDPGRENPRTVCAATVPLSVKYADPTLDDLAVVKFTVERMFEKGR